MAVVQLLLLFAGLWLFASSVALAFLAALLVAEARATAEHVEHSSSEPRTTATNTS